jgi:hypothetical protein
MAQEDIAAVIVGLVLKLSAATAVTEQSNGFDQLADAPPIMES